LIQSFSKLKTRHINLKLLVAIGKPPERLKTEFQEAYKMLEGYLRLHGVRDRTVLKAFHLDEMAKVYRFSDVFALPSENETFGQVFIESMASGTPVIGTKVGGVPEIIRDLHNGFLITPNDSSVLAQRIETLLLDNKIRQSFIEEGIKTVKTKFSLENQFSNFSKMLEQTVL
jgi:glycosyltransferase involved in cell wall biosynthesis